MQVLEGLLEWGICKGFAPACMWLFQNLKGKSLKQEIVPQCNRLNAGSVITDTLVVEPAWKGRWDHTWGCAAWGQLSLLCSQHLVLSEMQEPGGWQ